MILRIHHSGMMVDDLDKAVSDHEALGFTLFRRFEKPGMQAAMMLKGDAGFEFWIFDNPNGRLEQMIKHHTAFVSDDLESDVQKYLDLGYELAIPIEVGKLVKRFAYLKDSAGNYTELIEL